MQTMPDILEEPCQGEQSRWESTPTAIGSGGYEGYWAASVAWGEVVEDDRIAGNPINRVDPSGLLTVYIWDPINVKPEEGEHKGNPKIQVGHAAMMLEDGTYISYWPGGDTFSLHTSLMQDTGPNGEGRNPDGVWKITGLDEAAIKRWWDALIADPNAKFSLLHNNCSKTVSDGLSAGSHDPKYDLANRNSQHALWTPHDVETYARQLSGDLPSNESFVLTFVDSYFKPSFTYVVDTVSSLGKTLITPDPTFHPPPFNPWSFPDPTN